MLAARAHPGSLEVHLDEIDVPDLGPDEVLVKVVAAGISPGMLRVLELGRFSHLPSTLGPDGAGTVVAAGTGVDTVKVGERVRIHPNLNCRNCVYCRSDRDMMCPRLAIMGHGAFGDGPLPLYARYHDGALAEYVRVPYWLVDLLPDRVSFEVGAKVNHLATAARALTCARIEPGATVILTAATGSIGAATVLLAHVFGIARLVLVGRSRQRLAAVSALACGVATDLIATDDLPSGWAAGKALSDVLKALLPDGADAVVDYTPTGPTVAQCAAALSTGGYLVHLGSNTAAPWPLSTVMMNCWTIVGIRGATRNDSDYILALLGSGAMSADALITHRYPLYETPEAIRAMHQRGGDRPMWMVVAQP
ncbi:zinc-dependent alcohol dehydrogenase [Mycobacterium sp. 48b]|uniref:zinc-dependent alcohol dehydrogenase n=1 Tax=Mycobacterium sp. 48b TaxID=3400426 RepID=UPI003AAAEE04